MDGLPYSSLLYGNGPGYTSPRAIPSNTSEEERNAVHGAAVPRQWATHGGEDVPVYAQVVALESLPVRSFHNIFISIAIFIYLFISFIIISLLLALLALFIGDMPA